MLTLPASRSTQPWHQQRPIRKAVLDVFRYCSRKLSYALLMKPSADLAWVMPERRLVFITASLPEVPAGVRFDPVGEDLRRSLFLVGFAAHEAGHVRFSGPKPPGTLGELWNALEDERMERLMARAYPELRLAQAFTFLGDVVSARAQEKFTGSALEGCLFWRWEHDRLQPRWQVNEQDADLWEDVRPLVEAAWHARDSDQVTWIARQILGLIRAQQQEQLQAPDTGAPQPGNGEGQDTAASGSPAPGEPGPDGTSPAEAEQGGDEEGAGEDTGDDLTVPESWEGQVSATGANADARDGSAEATATQSPEEQAELERQLAALRGGLGAGHEGKPIIPAPAVEAAGELLAAGVEGYARQLAPLLRPQERPGMTTSHRSKGRFRYDRYAQGAEKQFARKTVPSKPQATLIDLLVDVSASMAGERLECAAQGALLLTRAAALTGSRVRVTAFNKSFQEVVPVGSDFRAASHLIAGLSAGGGTRLFPALEHVLATSAARPDEIHVVGVICDGDLSNPDYAACQDLVKTARAQGVRFIPILIGDALQAQAHWRQAFGAAVPCADLAALAAMLKATLTAMRARTG